MRKNRRLIEVYSLSFLDVISCGFGAIVLLLVIMKIAEPTVVETKTEELRARLVELQGETPALRSAAGELADTLRRLTAERDAARVELDGRRAALAEAQRAQRDAAAAAAAREAIVAQLLRARQELTEEMRRLQRQRPVDVPDAPIGGVPVDSEYIIFVIDTSGSMQQFAWPTVREKMDEILRIYPRVKGIQVMNDMGDYMFSQYAGRWIPDSEARRRAILRRLVTWTPFSNSSPVEGITAAIRRFYATDKKISIYVFGDDFSRGSIQEVVDTVDAINSSVSAGARRVRIHAVGFPVLFDQRGAGLNVARFAALMRRLAEDNNGSFVGLTSLRR